MASYSVLSYLAQREGGRGQERRLVRGKLRGDKELYRKVLCSSTLPLLLPRTCWLTMDV